MGMTITEKILARHAGLEQVTPGQIIEVDVDLLMINDVSGPLAVQAFKSTGRDRVFDPSRLVIVLDHYVPNKDVAAAEQAAFLTNFAKEMEIKYFYKLGQSGIEHVLLPDEGLIMPGDLVIGADSHTVTYGALSAFATGMGSTDVASIMITGKTWLKVPKTIEIEYKGQPGRWVSGKDLILRTIAELGVEGALYCAMEFKGVSIRYLGQASRFTMANMAVEAGAKNGIFLPDGILSDYVKERTQTANRRIIYDESDRDATYERHVEINIEGMEPQVALPPLPSNVKPVSELKNIRIDQVFIGSCTNGRIEDLRIAAKILKGKKIHKDVRMIIIPATQAIFRNALSEGLLELFLDAGGVIGPPTCGPCLGGHMGVLAPREKCISTTNRNFIGRMGHKESEVYLSNPAVAAASAILGRIGSPEEVF